MSPANCRPQSGAEGIPRSCIPSRRGRDGAFVQKSQNNAEAKDRLGERRCIA